MEFLGSALSFLDRHLGNSLTKFGERLTMFGVSAYKSFAMYYIHNAYKRL